MKKHRTQNNYDYTLSPGEINYEPSKTVPNESLSIREILQHYVRGVPLPVPGRNPYYSNTEDPEDFDETMDPAFDLADATTQKRLLDETIADRKQQSEQKKQEKQKLEAIKLAKKTDDNDEGGGKGPKSQDKNADS